MVYWCSSQKRLLLMVFSIVFSLALVTYANFMFWFHKTLEHQQTVRYSFHGVITSRSHSFELPNSRLHKNNLTPTYKLGEGPDDKVSIIIGIPSVKRSGASYLHPTLHSIFHNVYPVNEDSIFVIVMLAETDQDFVEFTGRKIYESFTRQVDSGLLQVITPNASVYPNFDNLKPTLGDPLERVKWRSKEVYDAAYLMLYCQNKADYYLMLEDDVISSKGYVGAIHNFIAQHKDNDFAYLSLANFNSIGKLFRMSDIPTWSTYFFIFFGLKPIDWLMNDFVHVLACHPEMSSVLCEKMVKEKKPLRHPSIFQHIGTKSSLKGKHQSIIDKDFSNTPVSSNFHKNPAAKVLSSFEGADARDVQSWYDDGGGMNFHYDVKPNPANQHISIVFENTQKVSKILVKTGKNSREYVLPYNSTVLEYQSSLEYEQCAVFDGNGEAECRVNRQIKSVRIRLLKDLPANVCFDTFYIK